MKLKTLLLVVGLLAAASFVVYFINRPAPRAATDARAGQPLLPPEVPEQAARFRLTDNGATVELARAPDGTWRVASFHDLPADFSKLARLVRELTDARIERLVTRSTERIERLELTDASLSFSDASGAPLWSVDLGRTAEGGGRFVRFEGEDKAYLARLSTWLDATARNWANSALVAVAPDQVAKIELTFPEGVGGTLIATRETADAPFVDAAAPAGQQLRRSALDSLLTTLTNLRFTDTAAIDDVDVQAANEHRRTATLTTFDGQSVDIALGRRPEQTIATVTSPDAEGGAPADSADEADPEPETETVPAGPVVAFVNGPAELAPLAGASVRIAFKVSDYSFTSLPDTRAELFEPAPASEGEGPTGAQDAEPAAQSRGPVAP